MTTEYVQTTGDSNWQTRVGAFKYPSCNPLSCGDDANYEISSSGSASIVPGTTDIGNHCDDCTTNIPIGFTMQLYANSYTSVNVVRTAPCSSTAPIPSTATAASPPATSTMPSWPTGTT